MKIRTVGDRWYFEDGDYHCNGWTVWSTGFEWKIKRPDGFVYAVGYKTLKKAIAFADKKGADK